MGTKIGEGAVRVTVTMDPADLDILDRLAALEGKNRSEELRTILGGLRPALRATASALEAAVKARDKMDADAARAAFEAMTALLPDAERVGGDFLASMARLETLAVTADVRDPS